MLKILVPMIAAFPMGCLACDSLTIHDTTKRSEIQSALDCLAKENASQKKELEAVRAELAKQTETSGSLQDQVNLPPILGMRWANPFEDRSDCLGAAEHALTVRGYAITTPRKDGGSQVIGKNEEAGTKALIACYSDGKPFIVVASGKGYKASALGDVAELLKSAIEREAR